MNHIKIKILLIILACANINLQAKFCPGSPKAFEKFLTQKGQYNGNCTGCSNPKPGSFGSNWANPFYFEAGCGSMPLKDCVINSINSALKAGILPVVSVRPYHGKIKCDNNVNKQHAPGYKINIAANGTAASPYVVDGINIGLFGLLNINTGVCPITIPELQNKLFLTLMNQVDALYFNKIMDCLFIPYLYPERNLPPTKLVFQNSGTQPFTCQVDQSSVGCSGSFVVGSQVQKFLNQNSASGTTRNVYTATVSTVGTNKTYPTAQVCIAGSQSTIYCPKASICIACNSGTALCPINQYANSASGSINGKSYGSGNVCTNIPSSTNPIPQGLCP